MEKYKNEKEAVEPILGASLLYYPLDEFEEFLQYWEGIISEDELIPSGTFYKYVDYLTQLYKASKKEEDFSKERKIKFVKLQINLETDKVVKNRFTLWFEDLLSNDDPSLFSLAKELFYKYCWICYKDKITIIDKKDIPFEDKLYVKPIIAQVKSNNVFSKLSDSNDVEGTIYPLGIKFMDKVIQPMTSQFVVIAGRPGNGKSSVLLRYALNLAEQQVNSLYISLEMGTNQIRGRMASAFSGRKITKEDVKGQNEVLCSKEFQKLDKHINLIVNGSHDADTILRRMEQAVEDMGVKVILLDYMNLCKFATSKDEFASLRELTGRLKRFAMEHDVLVVSCAQASRDSENHGLLLSDLYGSSTIEADSDIVIGIEQRESKGGYHEDGIKRGKLKILKNRDGEVRDFDVEINYIRLEFSSTE